MTYVTTSIRKARKAIQDGQADGIASAIALLVDAQPDVHPDNQNIVNWTVKEGAIPAPKAKK